MGLPDIENIPDTGAVFTIGRSRFAENVASHFFIRKDPVVSVTCGDEHSAVVCQSGRLFVFGSNDWGQLGLGHKNHVSKPSCVKVLKPEKVTHVACGRAHTLICTGEQRIFACGSDQESQLGRGSQAIGDSSSAPFLIHDLGNEGSKVRQIAAGSHHSLALLQDGTILAWGSNLEGQLGLPGTSGLVDKPTKVQIPETVKQISAGYYHSAFLTETGNVYVCGEAESGKLGIALDFRTQVAPKQMQLPGPAILVACGGHHTLIFGEDGNIYCTGSNSSGQLGMGLDVTEITTPKILPRGALQDESIKKIGCGESHIAIVTESGKLFTCGDGRHGKLGLEENENNVHELTQASRYNELVVTDVSCGGCHTILVGRRRATSNEVIDNHEQSVSQKMNPLPPLKMPVARISSGNASCEKPERFKMTDESNANEIGSTETENSAENIHEKAGESIGIEKPVSPKSLADYDDSIVKVSSSTDENELKTERMVNNNGDESETSVDVKNNMADGQTEEEKVRDSRESSGSLSGEITNEENEKSANDNGVLETTEKDDSPPLPVPPPKPPRQKIGSADTSQSSRQGSSSSRLGSAGSRNKNDDERDEKIDQVSEVPIGDEGANDEDDEETNKTKNEDTGSARKSTKSVASAKSIESAKSVDSAKSAKSVSSEKSRSAKSKAGTDETAEADAQNSLDDVEDNVPIEEEPKIVPDDADVVQSPAPRTGKMAKLFKTKKQEVENGIKEISTISTKAKSKTCSIL